MRTVKLYGALGARYGRTFVLDVMTPAEAVRALCSLLPGFKASIMELAKRHGLHVRVGQEYRGEDEFTGPTSKAETIRLIPATAGSAARARVIAGVVIMAVAVYFHTYAYAPQIFAFGASLALGGVAELMAPKPKVAEQTKNPDSYVFSGDLNTTGQGVPVPLVYGGPILAGSHVISSEVSNSTADGVLYASAADMVAPSDTDIDFTEGGLGDGVSGDDSTSYDGVPDSASYSWDSSPDAAEDTSSTPTPGEPGPGGWSTGDWGGDDSDDSDSDGGDSDGGDSDGGDSGGDD